VAISAAAVGAACLAGCVQNQPERIAIDPGKAYIDAKAVLLQAAEDEDPATRSHALEALAGTLGDKAGAVYLQALDDEMPAVRFAAALAIGDVRYKPAMPKLLELAKVKVGERDKRVYCAVIYALYRLGNDAYAGELGTLLFDSEREVRMDAALVMGKMGEPSAIGPLRTAAANEQDDGVKLQLTESLALLGDTRSAEVIEAYTKGYFLDLRLAAIPALGRIGSSRALRALQQLCHERHPARVRVSAAGELARLGRVDDAAYKVCIAAIRDPKKVLADASDASKRAADQDAASLKRLAALAAGWMKREAAANDLHPMLRSADGGQRVAAALSVVRLLKAYRPLKPPRPATRPAAAKPEAAAKKPKLHTAGGRD